jgi:hypothetical protein
MCFSAGASFGASAVLSVIGVAVIKKAKSPNQIPFASIPLIFAVQQFSEGFVWLALSNPVFASMEKISSYTFLVFAQIIWPLFVPISIALLEKNVKRKKILKIFIGVGVLVSSYFAHRLLMYGVQPSIAGHHIAYRQVHPDSWGHVADIFYGIATLAPTFLSKVKKMWAFGLLVSISYLITAIFYANNILSVWCFFAAIISIMIAHINAKFLVSS